jgi:hypothetical protein
VTRPLPVLEASGERVRPGGAALAATFGVAPGVDVTLVTARRTTPTGSGWPATSKRPASSWSTSGWTRPPRFSERFTFLDASDRPVYFAAVLATAAATLCLVAPTAHHRLRFRAAVKEHLLRVATVLASVGLALLTFAVSAVTYVITDLVYPGAALRTVAAVLAGAFVVMWFVLSLFYGPAWTPKHGGSRG